MNTLIVNVGPTTYAVTWGNERGDLRTAYRAAAELIASADDNDYHAGLWFFNRLRDISRLIGVKQ